MNADESVPRELAPVSSDPMADDTPAFGTYVGRCGETDLALASRGVSRTRRTISEKRWQWFCAFDASVAVGGAVVDGGFFGTAFLWVFDRERNSLVVDADTVVPAPLLSVTTHPTVGHIAAIDRPGRRLRIERTRETLSVDGRFGDGELSLSFGPDDDRAITAVCPVDARRRGVNITQKEPGVPVSGRVETPTGVVDIDGVGLLDYSHGLLGRDTRWHWAFAHDKERRLAFNLVDRFNDGRENVVWVDGKAQAVGAATLDRGEERWRVTTDCGTVDATLTIEGRRREDIDIGVVRSFYDQPLGRWEGTVAGDQFAGVGVAEDHHTRW